MKSSKIPKVTRYYKDWSVNSHDASFRENPELDEVMKEAIKTKRYQVKARRVGGTAGSLNIVIEALDEIDARKQVVEGKAQAIGYGWAVTSVKEVV